MRKKDITRPCRHFENELIFHKKMDDARKIDKENATYMKMDLDNFIKKYKAVVEIITKVFSNKDTMRSPLNPISSGGGCQFAPITGESISLTDPYGVGCRNFLTFNV